MSLGASLGRLFPVLVLAFTLACASRPSSSVRTASGGQAVRPALSATPALSLEAPRRSMPPRDPPPAHALPADSSRDDHSPTAAQSGAGAAQGSIPTLELSLAVRLPVAGRLLEIYTGRFRGEVYLDGKLLFHGDTENDVTPWRTVERYFGPIPPFDGVVLLRELGQGNACDGFGFAFLGINEDGTYELADLPYCGGPEPIIRATLRDVTISAAAHPVNRGSGTIPARAWRYRNGKVHPVAYAEPHP